MGLARVANRNRARTSSENAWLLSFIFDDEIYSSRYLPLPRTAGTFVRIHGSDREAAGRGEFSAAKKSFNATTPSHYILKVEIRPEQP